MSIEKLICGTSTTADLLTAVNQAGDVITGLLKAQGLSGNFGLFSVGFDYTEAGDVGIADDWTIWEYAGSDPLPVTVAPGTVPSAPDYEMVSFNDHSRDINRNAVGAHDDIYARTFDDLSDLVNSSYQITAGKVIKLKSYRVEGVGGGDFLIVNGRHDGGMFIDPQRTLPTDWSDLTQLSNWYTDSGSDTLCIKRINKEKITPEDFGVIQGEPSQIAYTRMAQVLGVVECQEESEYFFDGPVAINNNFRLLANKSSFIFGDGHTTLFQQESNVDYIEFHDVENVTVQGVTVGDFCYKNFFTSYVGGTVIGFPDGDLKLSGKVVQSNCNFGASRFLSGGSVDDRTEFISEKCTHYDDQYITRPCALYAGGHFKPEIKSLKVKLEANEDLIKITGLAENLIFKDSIVEHTGDSYLGQVDLFTGLNYGCVKDNKFKNVQLHRKQSGAGVGQAFDIGNDEFSGNVFILKGMLNAATDLYPLYWRGSEGDIHNNKFIINLDPSSGAQIVAAAYLDNEEQPVGPGGQTQPHDVDFDHNRIIFKQGSGGANHYGVRINSGSASEKSISITNNKLRGGGRFTFGSCNKFTDNEWLSPVNPTGSISANITGGNILPESVSIVGVNNKETKSFSVQSGNSIDANESNFFRIGDAGTTITSIANGSVGQVISIYARTSSLTIEHSNDLRLKDSINVTPPNRGVISFLKVPATDGFWQEISRNF